MATSVFLPPFPFDQPLDTTDDVIFNSVTVADGVTVDGDAGVTEGPFSTITSIEVKGGVVIALTGSA